MSDAGISGILLKCLKRRYKKHENTNYRIASGKRDIWHHVPWTIDAALDTPGSARGRTFDAIMAKRAGRPHFRRLKFVAVETYARRLVIAWFIFAELWQTPKWLR
jgi:hypothetical protein